MAKILVVEDDKNLCEAILDCLCAERHTVESVHNGQEALHLLRTSIYDLVVLDINLPGMNGIELCQEVRRNGQCLGILMLTGRDSVPQKEEGLDAGADDYLVKPFHTSELTARVRAVLRRSGKKLSQNELTTGNVVLDLVSHQVTRAGEEIRLSPKEFALLEFLIRHKGEVFSAEALVARVWPADNETPADMIRSHIAKLRKKLDREGEPSVLRTIAKVGYMVVP